MFTNEFQTSGTVKVNGSVIKSSLSNPDKRTMFAFVQTYNGINYIVNGKNIR